MKYANHKKIKERGMDPKPQVGDVVEWTENRERWTAEEGDFSGPQALAMWPDGGWCNVNLISRGSMKVKEPQRG